MRRLICAILVLAAYSVAQETGPFGLKAGMTRKQMQQIVGAKAVVSEHGNDVTYSTVPQPHPLWERMRIQSQTGVCESEGVLRVERSFPTIRQKR
jgi:hypothetical protein